jgi:hypothetical protein
VKCIGKPFAGKLYARFYEGWQGSPPAPPIFLIREKCMCGKAAKGKMIILLIRKCLPTSGSFDVMGTWRECPNAKFELYL